MQYPGSHPALGAKATLTALALVLGSLILITYQCFPDAFTTEITDFSVSAGSRFHHAGETLRVSTSKAWGKIGHTSAEEAPERPVAIPNIVHFVHLVDPDDDPVFEFPFRQFVAIYSAWYHLRPETIFIHTNVEDHLIQDTLNNTANPYTQAVSKLPGVKFSHHRAPRETTAGVAIDKLPNQSDFVRTAVLRKLGGVYLDDDAYILRDLKPLRYLAFKNVVGRQSNGQLCPAVILSTPNNNLITAYHDLQDSIFTPNSWARHATDLLSRLVIDFEYPDHQVLILPQDTFFPLSWGQPELKEIYNIHNKDDDDDDDDDHTYVRNEQFHRKNTTRYVEKFEMDKPGSWKRDWRLSYVLHGWSSGIGMNMGEEARDKMFGKYGGITLSYVMARNSNFARAVYPAVKHALDHDVLNDVDLEEG